MNKKRKAKRFVKRGSEPPTTTIEEVKAGVEFAVMVFGMFNAMFNPPKNLPKVGTWKGGKAIDNTQDADAEIISSQIKDNAGKS